MRKDRVIAFNDAILAIIMTILVLNLPEPNQLTWHGLWKLRASFFSYALSFFWLGIMWVGLHIEWENVRKVSVSTLCANLVLLFWVSFFPYTTKIASTHFDNKVAQIIYGVVVTLATLANIWMSHTLSKVKANRYIKSQSIFRQKWLTLNVLVKVIGIIIAAFIYPPAAMIAVILSVLITSVPAYILRKIIFS